MRDMTSFAAAFLEMGEFSGEVKLYMVVDE
jgi:hypothetical protein